MSDTSLLSVFWADHPATQQGIGLILLIAAVVALFVYFPLRLELLRANRLRKKLIVLIRKHSENASELRRAMLQTLRESRISNEAAEFVKRWESSKDSGGRAPVRFATSFIQSPLLPTGWRRSLLPAIPGMFLALGILGTFVGLTLAVSNQSINQQMEDSGIRAEATADQVDQLIGNLALAFRTSLWGIVLSLLFVVSLRRLEGHFEEEEEKIDQLVHRAFPWISEPEVAALAAREQRLAADQLRNSLQEVAMSLENAITAGLERIEKTTSDAASGVSEALVKELGQTIREGVGAHVEALREAIEKTTQTQSEIGESLALAFEQIRNAADAQRSAAENLSQSADAVGSASAVLSGAASELSPVVENLALTGESLKSTSQAMASVQQKSSEAIESVRSALEDAKHALDQQRSMVQSVLGELHSSIQRLSEGLSDDLVAALERVDSILGNAVGRLSGTIHDSNEVLDRMTPAVGRVLELSSNVEKSISGLDNGIQTLATGLHEQLGKIPDSIESLKQANDALVSKITKAVADIVKATEISVSQPVSVARSRDGAIIQATPGLITPESRKELTSTGQAIARQPEPEHRPRMPVPEQPDASDAEPKPPDTTFKDRPASGIREEADNSRGKRWWKRGS